MKAGHLFFRGFLIALSLFLLALATFAGLMHEWHRLAFISLAGLDYSLPGTLAFQLGGIVCWIWAACLSDD
jgi:hypothetical protein